MPQPNSEPILVLTTGGIIDKQYFDALSRYQITDSVIGKLLGMGSSDTVTLLNSEVA